MLKQLLTGAVGLFILSFACAGRAEGKYFDTHLPFSDTADKKDSLTDIKKFSDSKQEFRDLLTPATISDGLAIYQLNPQAISFVEDYIEKNSKSMEGMKDWGKPYFDMMDAILVQHGLPKELKYLAVIESQLKTNARSRAGAVGPWQFMPTTARNMGLKIGKKYDERRDFSKSTHAASKYLTNLFAIYGDWLLVIAAYNGGPGRVNTAIKKSGSTDFWTLQKYLPAESKNHVKKFIAAHYMMEGQGGIATATKDEIRNMQAGTLQQTGDFKTQPISGRYNSYIIAKHITMDIVAFNKMNPDFDKFIAANGNYELSLPVEKMDIFLTKKPEILNESMQLLLTAGTN
jgi:membrane-bound lytic murein transglycosylase D